MRHNSSLFYCLIASALALIGCRQESLEKDGFQLYYSGVTNIGPNLTVELKAHHFGGEPTEFAITGVTYEDSEYTGDGFEMNGEDGTVTVSWAPEIKSGEYSLSVSCKVDGMLLSYPDIIKVTFFKGVPDNIKVTPDTLILPIQELAQKDTAAVITTDNDHVSITGYSIANIRYEDEAPDLKDTSLFRISKDGVIAVMKSDQYKLGTYNLDIKLTTVSYDSTSTEGLFTDALTVKVVSAPQRLSYTPDNSILEEETKTKTSFRSAQPVMTGGTMEDVVWKIAACTPANSKLKIDEKTGILSIAENHGLQKGVTYIVDVNVKNRYSTEDGLTVKGAYSIEIVEYIDPINHFGYDSADSKQGLGWTVEPDADTDSEHIRSYEWTDPEAKYTKQLVLDSKTGNISAKKGNSLPVGTHDISVTASNGKTGGEVVAVLSLEIQENPYYFTYFSYGNNLGLTEEQTKGVSQFRVGSGDELMNLTAAIQFSDMSDAAASVAIWSVKNCNKLNNLSIDPASGAISFPDESGSSFTSEAMGIALITAEVTDPEDSENTFKVTAPFCVDFAAKVNDVLITYDPFVLRVNPKTGGRSAAAKYEGVTADKLLIDFRRSFNYYNIDGVDSNGNALINGAPNKEGGSFLQKIWDMFTEETGLNLKDGKANYGARAPVSFYNDSILKDGDQLSKTAAYSDNTSGVNQFTLVVSPGVWYADGWADGIFTGQMTFATDGQIGSVSGGGRRAPVCIWLDKDFEE